MKLVEEICPTCGARLNEPCRNPETGEVAMFIHPDRLKRN